MELTLINMAERYDMKLRDELEQYNNKATKVWEQSMVEIAAAQGKLAMRTGKYGAAAFPVSFSVQPKGEISYLPEIFFLVVSGDSPNNDEWNSVANPDDPIYLSGKFRFRCQWNDGTSRIKTLSISDKTRIAFSK